MKNFKLYLLLLLSFTLFYSCEKEPEASCSDGILNGSETAIDCGGECSSCHCIYEDFEGVYNPLQDDYNLLIDNIEITQFNESEYTIQLISYPFYPPVKTEITDCKFNFSDPLYDNFTIEGEIGENMLIIKIVDDIGQVAYEWFGEK